MKSTSFEIPKGCNRVTIEQQGNKIVTTFEPEFKEGDILVKKYKDGFFGGMEYIFILDNIDIDGLINYKAFYSKRSKSVTIGTGYGIGSIKDSVHLELRYATESERQLLFNAIAKEGRQWNVEKKCIEDLKPKKWRAEEGGRYYYVNEVLSDVDAAFDLEENIDNGRYMFGNYFETEKQALDAAEKIKELLKQINP